MRYRKFGTGVLVERRFDSRITRCRTPGGDEEAGGGAGGEGGGGGRGEDGEDRGADPEGDEEGDRAEEGGVTRNFINFLSSLYFRPEKFRSFARATFPFHFVSTFPWILLMEKLSSR